MNLNELPCGKEYIIKDIRTGDEELESFLLTLGCYRGERVTVITKSKGGCTIAIKDGRYRIDKELADAIIVSD